MLGNKRVGRLDVRERSIGLSRLGKVNCFSLLQLLVLFPELVDSINHLLDKLNLRVSKSVLVGDVIGVSSLATRLSAGSTGLQVELLTSLLQFVNAVLGPSRKVNMDRGSHTSSQVGWARVDVTILPVQTEVLSRFFLDRVSNSLDTSCKSLKDTLDISTLLHGDNSELILFIDPDKEGLGSIVEDTSALRPVSLHTSNSKVSVSRDEEEVVINKLLSDLLIHASQGVVFTSKITREGSGGILHKVLNTKTLLFGDSGGKTKSVNGTTNPDSGRVDWNIRVNVAIDLTSIHVRCVLGVG